jgi:tRNA-binding EMAP/Myf-like protein
MKFGTSEAMLLAASDKETLSLIIPQKDVSVGSRLS